MKCILHPVCLSVCGIITTCVYVCDVCEEHRFPPEGFFFPNVFVHESVSLQFQNYVPTVFENYTASFEIDKHRIELNMWDTSGKTRRRRSLSFLSSLPPSRSTAASSCLWETSLFPPAYICVTEHSNPVNTDVFYF